MITTPTCLERAYELARTGETISDIRAQLRTEGYMNVDAQLYGPTLIADLRRVRARALAAAQPVSPQDSAP